MDMNAYQGMVVEVVLCRAKDGVSEAEVRQAAEAAGPEMDTLPGLLKRELLLDANGQWIDVVHWRSYADSQNALQLAMTKPNILHLFSLLDESRTQMFHLMPVTSGQVEAI
jgi:hypothetical protein